MQKMQTGTDTDTSVYCSRRLKTCHNSPSECKTCKASGFCTSCKSGHTLSDYQCVPCASIDRDCRTCDENITQCYSCGSGRYLRNNTCLEGSAGCETCTDDSRCEKCKEGYYLNGRHGCTPCMLQCKECKDSMTCTQCNTGYGFDAENGECTPCKLGCTGVRIDCRSYPTQYLSSYSLFSLGSGDRSGGFGGLGLAHAHTRSVALSEGRT